MATYTRSADWIPRPVFGEPEGVLVPLVTSHADLTAVFILNETAAFIWEELRAPLEEEILLDRINACFESPDPASDRASDRARELRECLDELVDMGALRRE